MDPAFPDIVGEWAGSETNREFAHWANDNQDEDGDDTFDSLLTLLGELNVAATRLW
jgi:hypothetical protein